MAPMWGDGKKKGILVGKGNKKEKWPKRPPKKNLGKNGGEKLKIGKLVTKAELPEMGK